MFTTFFFPPYFHLHLLWTEQHTQNRICSRFSFSAAFADPLFDDSTQLPVFSQWYLHSKIEDLMYVTSIKWKYLGWCYTLYSLILINCLGKQCELQLCLAQEAGRDFGHGFFLCQHRLLGGLNIQSWHLIVSWPNYIGFNS